MFDFLKAHCDEIVDFVLVFVIALIQVIKYFKYNKELKMKYRTENTVEPTVGQKFETVVPVYKLDEKKNVLIVTGTIDLQELVQSSADCALKMILDKFGGLIPEGLVPPQPVVKEESDQVNVVELKEDLDYYQDVLDFQEDLRQRYKFKDGMTLDEMMVALAGMKKSVDSDIQKKLSKQVEVKKDEKAS